MQIQTAAERQQGRVLSQAFARMNSKRLLKKEQKVGSNEAYGTMEKMKQRLRSNHRSCRCVGLLVSLVFFALVSQPWTALAQSRPNGRTPAKPKRILVLCSYGYSLPAYQKLNPAFISVMVNAGVDTNDLIFEYLDLLRIKDSRHRQTLADLLRHKYALLDIDLIVTLHAPAMSFLLNEAKDIFPNVPMLSWNVQEAFKAEDIDRRTIHLSVSLDLQGTLQRALELFPQTKRVVFICGVSQNDKYVETEAKSVFADWENRLQFEYTADDSVEEVLKRVADLPSRSIVIYGNIFQDKTGRTFTPRDVGQMVAQTANAPVFGLYDTLMGLGVVGGSLLSFAADGERSAKLALDMLNGKIDQMAKIATMTGKPIPMFDWQQIEKWGAKVDNLPEGSIFINQPSAFWHRYAWYIIGLIGLLTGQFLLVASLLFQKARRGRAEAELQTINETLERRVVERTAKLQESEARYRSLFNSMTEGFALHEIITDTDGKPCDYRFLQINPAFERFTGMSRVAVVGKKVREVMPNIEPYWIETYGRVALEGTPIHIENYSASLNRWYEVFAYRTGERQFAVFFTDITERKQTQQALQQSEARYRNLFDNMAEEVHFWQVVRDKTGKIKTWRLVDVNPPALKSWGRNTVEEIRGMTTDEIFGPGAADHYMPVVQKIMTENVPYSFEDYFPNLDRYFRFTSVPLGDYFITTGADITVNKKTEAQLRQVLTNAEEGDRLLTALMEHVPEGIMMADAELNLTRVSRYGQQMLGGPQEGEQSADAVAQREIWHADGHTPVAFKDLPLVRAVQRGEIVKDAEIVQVGAGGDRLPLLCTAAPIRDATGNIIGGIVAWRDISVRKRAEEALCKTAEELDKRTRELNAILSSVQDFVYILDLGGRFVFANKKLLDLWGLSAEQAIGKSMRDLDYPEAVEAALLAGAQRVYQTGEVVSNETRYTSPKGVEGFFENILAPMHGSDGQVAFVAGSSRDITERRIAEKELQRLSQFPEENPNPVLRCTPDGTVLYANAPARQWLATLGWQPEGPLPVPARTTVTEACGESHAVEADITNPVGRTFNICAVQPPGEDYINLYGTDFTERKKAEKALRESEERLRASLSEKEVLLQEIHHRVKNNMQVISSLVALQAEDMQDDAMRAVLMDVTHRVRSMAMVHEKLYQSADLARVELADYVQSLLNYLWRAYGMAASSVRLSLNLAAVSLPVNAAVPCGLILNELVSNALKHAFGNRTDGEVAVSLCVGTQGEVRLCVRDNGSGLPVGFDWRQSRSLGLRLVQMLAGQLHASVEVASVDGTDFTISFGGPRT